MALTREKLKGILAGTYQPTADEYAVYFDEWMRCQESGRCFEYEAPLGIALRKDKSLIAVLILKYVEYLPKTNSYQEMLYLWHCCAGVPVDRTGFDWREQDKIRDEMRKDIIKNKAVLNEWLKKIKSFPWPPPKNMFPPPSPVWPTKEVLVPKKVPEEVPVTVEEEVKGKWPWSRLRKVPKIIIKTVEKEIKVKQKVLKTKEEMIAELEAIL